MSEPTYYVITAELRNKLLWQEQLQEADRRLVDALETDAIPVETFSWTGPAPSAWRVVPSGTWGQA